MAFPDELLELAIELANKEAANQAVRRRAVSTAYYALFHLLIDEAVGNWAVERQRAVLGRTFEHAKMKGICQDLLKAAKSGATVSPDLHMVAKSFIQLQQHRHAADYDNSRQWSQRDVVEALTLATDAFAAWREIRTQTRLKTTSYNYFCRNYPGLESDASPRVDPSACHDPRPRRVDRSGVPLYTHNNG